MMASAETCVAALTRAKKIWIDLDNSPHVPFFAPIIDELEKRGHAVVLTARDCFQVCELADLFHFNYTRVGHHYGKHRIWKVLGTGWRGWQLLQNLDGEKPDLAVSHGSRSHLLAARMAGIPSLIILDYEFAKPVPGLLPTWAMIPEVIPVSSLQFGHCTILTYPGIKEDVYVPRFTPDPALRTQLGLPNDGIIATIRPPASEAHYRNPESEVLLGAAIDVLGQTPGAVIVMLPRNGKQATLLRHSYAELIARRRMIIPEHAVGGLNLIWLSDVVISGGGTMNREAAAMGVPVYSIFRGPTGAVDRYLEKSGRLVLLTSAAEVREKLIIARRQRPAHTSMPSRPALNSIVKQITAILESGGPDGEQQR